MGAPCGVMPRTRGLRDAAQNTRVCMDRLARHTGRLSTYSKASFNECVLMKSGRMLSNRDGETRSCANTHDELAALYIRRVPDKIPKDKISSRKIYKWQFTIVALIQLDGTIYFTIDSVLQFGKTYFTEDGPADIQNKK